MAHSGHRSDVSSRKNGGFQRILCCYTPIPPGSPENLSFYRPKTPQKSGNSFPNSPLCNRTGLGLVGLIDPRRILSPGRVSPIDPDTPVELKREIVPDPSSVDMGAQLGSENFQSTTEKLVIPEKATSSNPSAAASSSSSKDEGCCAVFDVRLSLKGKNGGCLVLELDSEVLSSNSSVFADLISDCRRGWSSTSAANLCRIEVPDVGNLGVFHETIELMFEEDITRRLLKVGVSRSIEILEVSVGIMFTRGVLSCLKYLEAVPWSEDEEEKLKKLFSRFMFDDATARDVLARLYSLDENDSQQHLAIQLVLSVTNGANVYAQSAIKSLVKGLLSKSSVYEKDPAGLNKEDLYVVCQSCLGSLFGLFEEATDSVTKEKSTEKEDRPLIERISRQVDNINWLLEILLDQKMAEEFVNMWADQGELVRMHEKASPMIRYELSRISACIFIALGRGKLHCRSEARCGVLKVWFGPMLVDFGWLQRCRKGLNVKELEEATGHALLTLPLKQQHSLFMEWFQCSSRHGTECPNLSKAFQIWWRRSLRAKETRIIESQ